MCRYVPAMHDLYIARHGETLENRRKIIQGHLGGNLSEEGKHQAATLGKALQGQGIELIITGDLDRQLQTTMIVNKYLTLPIISTPHLKERGTGVLQGRFYQECGCIIEQDFGYYGNDGHGIFATAEPIAAVLQRARLALTLISERPEQRILIVGSGWMNSYLTNILLGEPLRYHDQDNAGVHYFKLNDGAVIDHLFNKKLF